MLQSTDEPTVISVARPGAVESATPDSLLAPWRARHGCRFVWLARSTTSHASFPLVVPHRAWDIFPAASRRGTHSPLRLRLASDPATARGRITEASDWAEPRRIPIWPGAERVGGRSTLLACSPTTARGECSGPSRPFSVPSPDADVATVLDRLARRAWKGTRGKRPGWHGSSTESVRQPRQRSRSLFLVPCSLALVSPLSREGGPFADPPAPVATVLRLRFSQGRMERVANVGEYLVPHEEKKVVPSGSTWSMRRVGAWKVMTSAARSTMVAGRWGGIIDWPAVWAWTVMPSAAEDPVHVRSRDRDPACSLLHCRACHGTLSPDRTCG
ncbi:hypothetical protein RJ55_04439 [Drechmeria coniospora]|nr:hypothetical protein RJ55_04439 [Drechmeria coniospora]